MRILYFHQHFSTPSGSTGTRSYEMARALVTAGHEVTMVCGSYLDGNTGLESAFKDGKRSGTVDGIRVIELALEYSNHDSFIKRSSIFFKFAVRSIGIVFKEPCDLVFATSTPLTAGLPGIFARWLKGKRFVFEVRDLWPELPREMGVITNPITLWLMSLLERVSYRSAHACIGLSPGIVDGIRRCSGKDKPITMVPNGCDLELFSKNNIAKRPHGINESDLMAVFTGAHGIANGLNAVLDAAEVLKRQGYNNIKLAFIGDGKLKPQLMECAKQKGLDNCLFLDPVPKTELVGYLKVADVGLMVLANVPAFYYGTSPNKFFDYLSVGLPVINNYPGWLADMINEHKCGVAVSPDDPNAFAEALIYLYKNPEKRKEMGDNAIKLALSDFDRTYLADQFVRFLEKIVSPELKEIK
ncbi:glycosyltransferase family 4 protein [Candidatus Scalindua japonica]|nr:glycosyltransferase family 4 protein [Candidatus Scalindua japonica]